MPVNVSLFSFSSHFPSEGFFQEKLFELEWKIVRSIHFYALWRFFYGFSFFLLSTLLFIGKSSFSSSRDWISKHNQQHMWVWLYRKKKKTVENRIHIRTWGSQRKRMGPWGLILHTNFPPFPPWRRKFILFRRKCKGGASLSLSLLRWSKANHFQEVV